MFKKINKKVVVGMSIFVVLISTVIIVALFLKGSSQDELLNIIFDPKKPVAFLEDDLFGYMDTKGNILIEPQYFTAGSFYGDYALVSKIENDMENYEIIDKSGNHILTATSTFKPNYYKAYGVWLIDNKLFDKNMIELFNEDCQLSYISDGYFSYRKNKVANSGLIDHTGKKIFSWDENYISIDVSLTNYDDLNLYAAISNSVDREEIISLKSGKVIYTVEDPEDTYLEVADDNIFRLISIKNGYKPIEWFYIKNDAIVFTSQDKISSIKLVDSKRDILMIDYGNDYIENGKNLKIEYYDAQTKNYLTDDYAQEESIVKEQYGYNIFACEGLYGLKKENKVLLDCRYTDISFPDVNTYEYMKEYHKRPIAIATNLNDITIFDIDDSISLRFYSMAALEKTEESTFLLINHYENDGFTRKDWIVYNLITDTEKVFPANTDILLYDNYITANDGNKMIYYDMSLKPFYEGTSYTR